MRKKPSRWPNWAQKEHLFNKVGYKPTPLQEAVHKSKSRLLAVFGGERAGKSRVVAAEVYARQRWCQRIAICGQDYSRCRAEFEYLEVDLTALGYLAGPAQKPQNGQWVMTTVRGCEIKTISLQDGPGALTGTGQAFDLVLIAEAGLVRYDCFLAARGRVAERRGAVILCGTLWDDYGWYADMWRTLAGANVFGGERFTLPTWENRAIFPGGQSDPEILALKAVLPPDEYSRRVDALIMPSPAKIYQEFSHTLHVRPCPFNDKEQVWLTIDAGYFPSAYAALAVQLSDNEHGQRVVSVIDEVYEHRQVHALVIEIAKSRPWWGRVNRAIGGHEVGQHQAAESTAEIWQRLTGLYVQPAPAGIMPGVLRVKTFLVDPATEEPRLYVDPCCQNLIREFGLYKRRTDSRGNVVSEEPEDKNNDCMDALRNLLVAEWGWVDAGPTKIPPRRDPFKRFR